jgi:hypothetical protein
MIEGLTHTPEEISDSLNNGVITARSRGIGSVAGKSGWRLSSGDLLAV